MKKLKAFAVHGTAVGSDKSIKLGEISILADPENLKDLGVFLISASYEMARNGIEHLHLQDLIENFSHKKHVDLIALNQEVIKPVRSDH
ncbi:hypothetical protein [Pseudomonas sp. HY7a-MNA-CIBAN-0227]|uniref:Imm32 family immunity protein n=1 Tax=Pseudomonas sp. HY7a-MNA-CIBAN-0227 TaxID=3140474 RepID=UPI003329FFBB